MLFKNPLTQEVRSSSSKVSWLWCLLFGAFYFMFKGNWKHVLLYILFGLITLGISMFVYPFLVKDINNAKYLRSGWIPYYPNVGDQL